MASIKCNRCLMTFEILDVSHEAKRSIVCSEKNCTRSFSQMVSGDVKKHKIKIFQTVINVSNTVNAAKYRRENGLPVDNGGFQEGINYAS